jgi:hypothetical protein
VVGLSRESPDTLSAGVLVDHPVWLLRTPLNREMRVKKSY